MKVLSMHAKAFDVEFSTANDIFKATITNNNGPELHLEDNSVLILPDTQAYYDLVNSPVYTSTIDGSEIDIDEYESIFNVLEDDVCDVIYENENITEAKKLNYIPESDRAVYRLFKEN